MPRSVSGRTARETKVNGRVSATSVGTVTVNVVEGNETRAAISEISGAPLDRFDELVAYLDAGALTGTTPTMDIYLQRAVRPNADPTVDADWEDYYHFTQVAAAALQRLVGLAALKTATAEPGATQGHARTLDTLAAESALPGHWGDKLRVREKIGGTVTVGSTWSLHVTGLRQAEPTG